MVYFFTYTVKCIQTITETIVVDLNSKVLNNLISNILKYISWFIFNQVSVINYYYNINYKVSAINS